MNARLLISLFAGLLLAAYSGQSAAELEAKPDNTCKGDPKAPMVTFNVNSGNATPECVKAHLGTTILVRLVPKKKKLERVSVTIKPKNSLDSWLHGKNEEFDDIILISVPGEYDPKQNPMYSYHKYSVVVGETTFDPRVEVEH